MRSGSRNIRTNFAAPGLTHFGGIFLLHQFLQQLRFRSYLSQHLHFRQRNNRYSLSELLLALVYPMILGLEKIEVSALLQTNGVFQSITGLPSFPDPTTLRRFLLRAAPSIIEPLRTVHNNLRQHFFHLPRLPGSLWLDCDSTVKTLYGHQEGVLKGFNLAHRGKRSYHPLVVTEAHRGDCLSGMLRPGNVHTAEGIDKIIETILPLFPSLAHDVRVRADAGFYSGDFISFLRDNGCSFAIVAHMTRPIRTKVPGLRYQKITPIFAVAEFHYQPHGWEQKERFVVLRRKLPKEEDQAQTTLFTFERYAYSVIVTDLDLQPYNVFQFYQDRSAMERIIRTLKEDYPFGAAPTNSFQANALYAELSLLAYNLMTWFKRSCLPQDWQSCTLQTIRHRLLLIPGEFIRTANIPTLRFPRNTMYQEVFHYADRKINRLMPLS